MTKLFEIVDEYRKRCNRKDFTLLKFCILALGIMLGISVSEKRKKPAFWLSALVFIATYIPVMTKLCSVIKDVCNVRFSVPSFADIRKKVFGTGSCVSASGSSGASDTEKSCCADIKNACDTAVDGVIDAFESTVIDVEPSDIGDCENNIIADNDCESDGDGFSCSDADAFQSFSVSDEYASDDAE